MVERLYTARTPASKKKETATCITSRDHPRVNFGGVAALIGQSASMETIEPFGSLDDECQARFTVARGLVCFVYSK